MLWVMCLGCQVGGIQLFVMELYGVLWVMCLGCQVGGIQLCRNDQKASLWNTKGRNLTGMAENDLAGHSITCQR